MVVLVPKAGTQPDASDAEIKSWRVFYVFAPKSRSTRARKTRPSFVEVGCVCIVPATNDNPQRFELVVTRRRSTIMKIALPSSVNISQPTLFLDPTLVDGFEVMDQATEPTKKPRGRLFGRVLSTRDAVVMRPVSVILGKQRAVLSIDQSMLEEWAKRNGYEVSDGVGSTVNRTAISLVKRGKSGPVVGITMSGRPEVI